MSIFSSILRTAYKISGAKKAFGLPEDEIKKVIEKQNRHRGVFTPTDRNVKPERLERFRSILDAYKPEDQSMETIQ